jgi:hypothetical protein
VRACPRPLGAVAERGARGPFLSSGWHAGEPTSVFD